jgi:hypothetical protein
MNQKTPIPVMYAQDLFNPRATQIFSLHTGEWWGTVYGFHEKKLLPGQTKQPVLTTEPEKEEINVNQITLFP